MNRLPPPLHSVDPVDWAMYADLLLEAGAPEVRAAFARRVACALHQRPSRVLIGKVGDPTALEKNPRRAGRLFFVAGPLTRLDWYSPRWWTLARVRAGMRRWSPEAQEHEAILTQAHGVPASFPGLIENYPALALAYFRSAARRECHDRSRLADQ
jgi:hypothetical protein